jgi:hypothetical protein
MGTSENCEKTTAPKETQEDATALQRLTDSLNGQPGKLTKIHARCTLCIQHSLNMGIISYNMHTFSCIL